MKQPGILHIDSLKGENWRDNDLVMLHACFQLLKNFIEGELQNFPESKNEEEEERREGYRELKELYNWWEARCKEETEGKTDPIWTEGQYEQDNEMLARLIAVRKYMWT